MYIGYDIVFTESLPPKPEQFIEKFKVETGLKEVRFTTEQDGYYQLSHPEFPKYQFVICFPSDSLDNGIIIYSHTPIIHYLLEATAATFLKLNGKIIRNAVSHTPGDE